MIREKNKPEKWMFQAIKQAEKAYLLDEVPIGCVIVKNDLIIGLGYNQVEQLNDSTAHAEIIAITSAANYLGDWRLNECSLYVTKEPCIMCFGAIVNSRINHLYYGLQDLENGFSIKIKNNNLFNRHLKKIKHGILKNDCKYLIQDFFINKRKNNKKTCK